MKNTLSSRALLLLTAGVVAFGAQASVLYRGRLGQGSSGTTSFPAGTCYNMTFGVYAEAKGGTALFQQVVNGVPVGTDGGFEVLLDAPALDAVFTGGARSAFVGLALDTERELMPRREILALPKTLHARLADKPGYRPHVTDLKAASLTAAVCSAGTLDVKGTLTSTGVNDSLTVRGIELKAGEALDVSSHPVTAFGGATRFVDCAKSAYDRGATLATAPCDGLAFVCLKSAGESAAGFSRTVLCRKGDPIAAPMPVGAGDEVLIRVTPFATR